MDGQTVEDGPYNFFQSEKKTTEKTSSVKGCEDSGRKKITYDEGFDCCRNWRVVDQRRREEARDKG